MMQLMVRARATTTTTTTTTTSIPPTTTTTTTTTTFFSGFEVRPALHDDGFDRFDAPFSSTSFIIARNPCQTNFLRLNSKAAASSRTTFVEALLRNFRCTRFLWPVQEGHFIGLRFKAHVFEYFGQPVNARSVWQRAPAWHPKQVAKIAEVARHSPGQLRWPVFCSTRGARPIQQSMRYKMTRSCMCRNFIMPCILQSVEP